MSNFLRKYSTEAEFNNADIDCKDTVVSYVTEIDSIEYAPKYVNGASIKAKSVKLSSSSPIKIEDCKPGDVLCALDDGSYVMTLSNETQGTPIGVCVIPTSHDVYGDGTCAVMSLKGMRYDTPTSGGNDQYIYWGTYNYNISGCTELVNYDKVNQCGVVSAQTSGVTTTSNAYLPSNRTTGGSFSSSSSANTCSHDSDVWYYSSGSTKCCPSPYLIDDSRNPMYYTTSASSANALSDFSGFGNTKIMTDLVTSQPNWKTDESITNTTGSTGTTLSLAYPAACCCWRYTANGKTDEGMWYLPACGELGYIMPKWNEIYEGISGGNGVQLNSYNYYWSSSEYSSYGARYVNTYGGNVDCYDKGSDYYVRAFLRVG